MNNIIGIIGGSGPSAGLQFCEKIVDIAHKKYGAVQDIDFPHFILSSKGLAGFDETGIKESRIVYMGLLEEVIRLQAAGCKIIVIACNTLHCFIDDLKKDTGVEIVNMIEITLAFASNLGIKKTGMMCSETTNRMKLYKSEAIHLIYPNQNQQNVINNVVADIMAGAIDESHIVDLSKVARDFIDAKSEAIILGCTELPIIIPSLSAMINVPLLDCTALTAEKIVDLWMCE